LYYASFLQPGRVHKEDDPSSSICQHQHGLEASVNVDRYRNNRVFSPITTRLTTGLVPSPLAAFLASSKTFSFARETFGKGSSSTAKVEDPEGPPKFMECISILNWSPTRVGVEAPGGAAPILFPGPFFVGVCLAGVPARGVPVLGVAVRDMAAIFSCFSFSLATNEMEYKR
jgi:hypothetical protein